MGLNDFMELEIYGSSLMQWTLAAGIATAIILAVSFAKPVVIRRLEKASSHTRVAIDDAVVFALRATRIALVAVVAIDVGSRAVELPPNAQKLLDGAAAIAFFVQVGLWASALLEFWLRRSQQKAATSGGAVASLSAIGFVGRIALWSIVALLALDNLGINITTLIAGLGIGGIAVALAAQNILGDLFASMSIVIDKPFVPGDFIIVDDIMGTVEHIGMKTTRIRSLGGEQIIVANGDLLKTRVRNYKRMLERRVVFKFGITYDTPPDVVGKVPAIVRRLIEAEEQSRFERSHFASFGESSLDFETVFWMKTPDYNLYMDVQQRINLALMRELASLGVNFAFPTRTLHTMEPLRLEARLPGRNGRASNEEDGRDEPPASTVGERAN